MKQKSKTRKQHNLFFSYVTLAEPTFFMVSFSGTIWSFFPLMTSQKQKCTQWNVMMRDIEQSLSISIQIIHVLRMIASLRGGGSVGGKTIYNTSLVKETVVFLHQYSGSGVYWHFLNSCLWISVCFVTHVILIWCNLMQEKFAPISPSYMFWT